MEGVFVLSRYNLPMKFKAACIQIAPVKANVPANLDKIAETALQAQSEGADLVCFSETATSGYFLEGGVLECALTPDELATELKSRLSGKITRPLDVSLGFYESSNGQLFNSSAYLELSESDATVKNIYRKFFLPTYGVFDEERFVARGREFSTFETRFGTFATVICEDVWHSIVPTILALKGAKVVLVPSASPARGFSEDKIGNLNRYRRLLQAISEEHGLFTINTQLCGFEGGKGFIGGSSIHDPFGKLVVESPVQEENIAIAELNLDLIEVARQNSPLLADLQSTWSDIRRALPS